MGADNEVVRAISTELSFISTKNPLVFFANSIGRSKVEAIPAGTYPIANGQKPAEWTPTTAYKQTIYKAKPALMPRL
jgi:hypothetical protein